MVYWKASATAPGRSKSVSNKPIAAALVWLMQVSICLGRSGLHFCLVTEVR